MRRDQLLQKIDREWGKLMEACAGLSAAQMTEPGVTGDWSVKDILAHVTVWDREALIHLPEIMAGRKPPRYKDRYGGLDAFNALKTAEYRDRSLATVLQMTSDTHAELVALVAGVPEEYVTTETPFRHRLRLDTYSHYPIHTRAIADWRIAKGYTAAGSQPSLPGLDRVPHSP